MGGMETAELLRRIRDKLLEVHERLKLEYTDPLNEFQGSRRDLESIEGVIFIYFTAGWCAPCISFMDSVRRVARSYSGRAKFYKVDIDKNMDLADALHIDYIPAFVAVLNGVVVDRVYGVVGYTRLENMVKRVLEAHS